LSENKSAEQSFVGNFFVW